MEAQRATAQYLKHQSSADERSALLQVPQCHPGQRSRSFDSAGSDDSNAASFLEVPKRFQRRRSSNTKTPPPCIHCLYLEEYERAVGAEKRFFIDHNEVKSLSYSDISSSDDDRDDERSKDGEGSTDSIKFGNLLIPPASPCNIKFTLSPTNGDYPTFPSPSAIGSPPASPCFPPSPTIELALFDEPPPLRARRRSISRQEAVFVEPTGNSLENVADAAGLSGSESTPKEDETDNKSEERKTAESKLAPAADIVQDIYLAVPDLKRDRAASVDSCFSKVPSGKTEELQPPDGGLTLTVPSNAIRSRSVDIVLPTNEQARYKALALAGPSSAAYLSKGYVFLL